MRAFSLLLTVLLSISLTGCGGSSSSDDAATAADTSWMLAEMPAGAVPVAQVKQAAREGDRVVVRGRIGGRGDPMTEGMAVFVMMDPAVPSCLDRGDACKKPWDYCCETPASITANSATVQLVGDAEGPMAIDLAAHGFEPLDEVVVVGTVGPRPDSAALIIHAEKIHRGGQS